MMRLTLAPGELRIDPSKYVMMIHRIKVVAGSVAMKKSGIRT